MPNPTMIVISAVQSSNDLDQQLAPLDYPNISSDASSALLVHQDLMQAIAQKNFKQVKYLVEALQPNLNYANTTDYTTPLLAAVKVSHVGMVQYLLEHGASLHYAADPYNAAVHYAVCFKRGSLEMLRLILFWASRSVGSAKIINAINSHGDTALHIATSARNVAMVEALLQFGAATNIESERGQIPLTIACNNKNTVLIQKLLQAGADPWISTRYWCPVAVSIRIGDLAMFQTLIHDSFYPDRRMEKGRTIAHVAALVREFEFLKWALEQGCNVNARDDNGQTPLHVLCNAGVEFLLMDKDRNDEQYIRLLAQYKADFEVKDREGNSPMHYAINREIKILQTLLQVGASPNVVDARGRTPLHIVCTAPSSPGHWKKNEPWEYVRALTMANANLDTIDHDGNTPIHYAVKFESTVLETLLNADAEPNTPDKDGNTALHLYCSSPNSLSFPKSKITKQQDAENAHYEIYKLLCSKGADIFLENKQGNLPVTLAAKHSVLRSAVFDMVCQLATSGLLGANRGLSKGRRSLGDDETNNHRRVKKRTQ